MDIEVGATYSGPYPFVRDTVDIPPEDPEGTKPHTVECWKPGVEWGHDGHGESLSAAAGGVGQILLTVVSIHRPGAFPTRVFYTRKWRDPDGREFGRSNLRVTTQAAFKRLARGYRHEFELTGA